MPTKSITITTTVSEAASRPTTYGVVGILGHDTGSQTVNTVREITSVSEAETYFGSDVVQAVTDAFAQGLRSVQCVRATVTEKNESGSVGNKYFTLSVRPLGDVLPVAKVDGVTKTTSFNCTAGTGTVVPTGEVYINPITRIVAAGDTPASSFTVDFSTADWATAAATLVEKDINIAVLAKTPLKCANCGDLKALQTIADTNNWILPVYTDANQAVATSVSRAADISSKNVMAASCNTTINDVAAAIAGKMSLVLPWDKMMWKSLLNQTFSSYNTETDIVTLETGKVNAVFLFDTEDLLSDGLTTLGSTYKYIDITRTQYYMEDTITTAIDALVKGTRIPYTEAGINIVHSEIRSALKSLVDAGAITVYTVEMPVFSSIPSADRTNRVLNNVKVTATLAGNIQTISLALNIEI